MAAEWNRPMNKRERERIENAEDLDVTGCYSQCRLRGGV